MQATFAERSKDGKLRCVAQAGQVSEMHQSTKSF